MRESSINYVEGARDAESAESTLRYFHERFVDQASFEAYRSREREKSADELAIIGLANELTNGMLAEYGLEPFDIPVNNFHFLSKEAAPEMAGKAFYNQVKQGAVVGETEGKFRLLLNVMHEMVHFKSWNAVQEFTMDNGKTGITHYRDGLSVFTRDGERKRLNNLNEAVTQELAERLAKAAASNPLVGPELVSSRELAAKAGIENTEEIIYAVAEEDGRVKYVRSAYAEHKKMLSILIGKIFEAHRDSYSDREQVFCEFASAAITGKMLKLGRLIDGTFGVGTLAKIADSDADPAHQLEIVESLTARNPVVND